MIEVEFDTLEQEFRVLEARVREREQRKRQAQCEHSWVRLISFSAPTIHVCQLCGYSTEGDAHD